jgi:hypothetical protein
LTPLHEYELDESARFDRMEREWERQRKDTDDVFLNARNRDSGNQRTNQGFAKGAESQALKAQRLQSQEA